jgi:hypothetical protein
MTRRAIGRARRARASKAGGKSRNASDRKCRSKRPVDKNKKRTYHSLIVIKEAMMQRVAVETLCDFAELVALGAFLTMIALAARAFGA